MLFRPLAYGAVALLPLLSPVIAAPFSVLNSRDVSFDYNSDKVRGVNLGGWFVLEPWITPSLFENAGDAVDEYTYTQILGRSEAYNRLSNHWRTFITEDDFVQIAHYGLNHVRIPVGYWAVAPIDGEPYVQGQLDILDQAIGWARDAKLKVVLDLHGAPGSQNGFDNSGRRGAVNWQSGDNVQKTLDAIEALAKRYASQTDVISAIQLLNEPRSAFLNPDDIKKFYTDGWHIVHDGYTTVIHDAFEDVQSFWNGFLALPGQNVILDTHHYQIFDQGQLSQSPSQHVQAACGVGGQLVGTDKWIVVGEWTGALTDCAKWLNGRDRGARYDGTLDGSSHVGSCDGKYSGSVAKLAPDEQKNIRAFIEAQLDAYEQHTGWFFWTWRNEAAPEWHMKDLLHSRVFPQPLTSRQYPRQCGY